MAELERVTLGVQRVADGDTEELLELTELLRGELRPSQPGQLHLRAMLMG